MSAALPRILEELALDPYKRQLLHSDPAQIAGFAALGDDDRAALLSADPQRIQAALQRSGSASAEPVASIFREDAQPVADIRRDGRA